MITKNSRNFMNTSLKEKIEYKPEKTKLRHNLKVWLIYILFCYIILIPFKMWITGISISILIGFLFGLLNDIITQLRKLNGEKF